MSVCCDRCFNNHENDGGECPFCANHGFDPAEITFDYPLDLKGIVDCFNSLPQWKGSPRKWHGNYAIPTLKKADQPLTGTINHLFYKSRPYLMKNDDEINLLHEDSFNLCSEQSQQKMIAFGEMVDGLKNGRWKYYEHYSDWFLAGEINYRNGIRHGVYNEYKSNGLNKSHPIYYDKGIIIEPPNMQRQKPLW
jgi:hypothetical protein